MSVLSPLQTRSCMINKLLGKLLCSLGDAQQRDLHTYRDAGAKLRGLKFKNMLIYVMKAPAAQGKLVNVNLNNNYWQFIYI